MADHGVRSTVVHSSTIMIIHKNYDLQKFYQDYMTLDSNAI